MGSSPDESPGKIATGHCPDIVRVCPVADCLNFATILQGPDRLNYRNCRSCGRLHGLAGLARGFAGLAPFAEGDAGFVTLVCDARAKRRRLEVTNIMMPKLYVGYLREVGGPVDPGYGIPGLGPVDPGWGVGGGFRPDNSLPGGGYPSHGLPGSPGHPSTGPIKPPGRPVVPPHPDHKPPMGGLPPHPWRPGHWEPVDPGYGLPPLFGWIVGPDNGLPTPPGLGIGGGPIMPPPGHVDGGLPTPPGHVSGGPIVPPGHVSGGPLPPVSVGGGPIQPPVTKPTPPGQGGVWVPTDPDYGIGVHPCPPCGGKPHPPIWAWIPDRPTFPDNSLPGSGTAPDNSLPSGEKATVTLYPTGAVAPMSGGSGSINVTITKPGTWQVDPTPEWLTVTPTGPQTTDLQIRYTAAHNPTGAARTGTITVNGATCTINQNAA
jgi:hypothetical protein